MAEEPNPSPANSTETTSEIVAPSDYREYVKWRQTGDQPAKETKEELPAAAVEEPPAKTEPQSGAEDTRQEQESENEPEQDRPGRGGSRQRRIDRLTRENEMLKQQLASMVQPSQRSAPSQAEPAKPVEAPGKPKLQDFQTLEAYQEALTDWKLDQREAKRKADEIQAAEQAQAQKIQADWSSREQSVRSSHSDYDEVLQSVVAPVGPGVAAARQAMLEDEAGPEILYYLGTHQEEMNRIAALQPVAAVMAIAKLSATLGTPQAPAANGKPKISSAPRPPAPLSRPSGATVKDNIHDPDVAADFPRWARARIAQLKGK